MKTEQVKITLNILFAIQESASLARETLMLELAEVKDRERLYAIHSLLCKMIDLTTAVINKTK